MPSPDVRLQAQLDFLRVLNEEVRKKQREQALLPFSTTQIIAPGGQGAGQGGGSAGGGGGGSGGGGVSGGGPAGGIGGLGGISSLTKLAQQVKGLLGGGVPASSTFVSPAVGPATASPVGGPVSAIPVAGGPALGGLGAAAGFSATGPGIAGLGATTSVGSIGAQTAATGAAASGAASGAATTAGSIGAIAGPVAVAALIAAGTAYAAFQRAKGAPKTKLNIGLDENTNELKISRAKGDAGVKNRDVQAFGNVVKGVVNGIRREVGGKFNPEAVKDLDNIFNLKAKGGKFKVPVKFGQRVSFGKGFKGDFFEFGAPDAVRFQIANALRNGFIIGGDQEKIDAKIAELEEGIFDREMSVVSKRADLTSGATQGISQKTGPALKQSGPLRSNIIPLLEERGLLDSQIKASPEQVSEFGGGLLPGLTVEDINRRRQQLPFR